MLRLVLLTVSTILVFTSFTQTQISFSAASNGQTFSTCNGFIIDSGGQGGSGYSNNENTTITICPDTPGDIIAVVFNFFNLNTTDDNPAPNVTNVDYMTVYDGDNTSANTLGTYTGNQLQGVVIQATPLNPTGCLTLTFTSNTVGTGNFTASATCETPCNDPIAGGVIVNGITADSIQVCVGDQVFFEDQGSVAQPGFSLVDYEWDFMDGTTANGTNVSHTFNIPGQYRIQLYVTDDNGCSNNNLIDLEVLVGTIPTFSGFPGPIELCLGESATLVADPESYEVTWNGFPGSQSVDDGCLTDDMLGVAQDIELVQTGFAAGTTIQNVSDIQSICLDMEHSFIGDLVVILECPNGQNVILHQQGGGGVNLGEPNQLDNVDCNDPTTQGLPYTYCFTPTATDTWVQAIQGGAQVNNSLPAGDYASVQPLANLVGCPTNGIWTLSVIDNWAADDGTLFSFGLTLDPSYYPAITSFEPQIGVGADSSFWSSSAMGYISNTSPDGNTITVEPTQAGVFDYTFYVTDNFGCEYDSTMYITVNDNATVFAGNDTTICVGNTVNLEAAMSNASGGCDYTLILEDTFGDGWNGNNITVTINGQATNYTLSSGDYVEYPMVIPNGTSVQLTFNANGSWVNECFFSVEDENGAVATQGGPNMNGATTVNFTANCAPDYVFDWQSATNLSDGTIQDPIWTPTANETVNVTVYPIGHPLCTSSDTISVTVINPPYAGLDSTAEFCSLAAPEDLFNYLNGNPETGGEWTNPSGAVVVMPFDPSSMPAGTYTYTVGAAACVDQATVDVTIIETEITASQLTNVSCNSGSDGEIAITGTNIDYYVLNGGAQVTATSPFVVPGLIAGNYTLEVFSNDGCSDQMTFDITQPLPLQLTYVSPDTLICSGGDAVLTANATGGSSAYTYTWTLNGSPVATGQTVTVSPPSGTNTYCVELSEACGSPTDNECTNVTVEDPIVPTLIPDTPAGCSPLLVNFTNASGGSIATTFIDFGDGTDTLIYGDGPAQHSFSNPQHYDLMTVITSTIGCVYTADFEDMIIVHPNPVAGFLITPNPVSMFDPEVGFSDYSTGNIVAWDWTFEGGNPAESQVEHATVVFPEGVPGTYPVTLYVTTEYGCTDSTIREVQVVNEVILYAPNTFTPDGDEFNQNWEFVIMGIDVYDFNLKIFNRWGELIWESNDPNTGWDGTYHGQVVPQGMYSWIIECKDQLNDKKYTFDGHVTVLR